MGTVTTYEFRENSAMIALKIGFSRCQGAPHQNETGTGPIGGLIDRGWLKDGIVITMRIDKASPTA